MNKLSQTTDLIQVKDMDLKNLIRGNMKEMGFGTEAAMIRYAIIKLIKEK